MAYVLYKVGGQGRVQWRPEETVTSLGPETLRGGIRGERWLIDGSYSFPKTGKGSEWCRACPQEQAEQIETITLKLRLLYREREEVLEEAWRRADKYKGPGGAR